MIKTEDYGENWEENILPSCDAINDITFEDAQNGYLIGEGSLSSGLIYETSDGGENWLLRDTLAAPVNSMQVSMDSTLYLCCDGGMVYGLIPELDNAKSVYG